MRRKNRQLKALTHNKLVENEEDDEDDVKKEEYTPPIAYDPNNVSLKNDRRASHMTVSSVDTDYSLSDDKPSIFKSFQEWCMNLGFSGKKTRCSWF